jgi:hypothetical protein
MSQLALGWAAPIAGDFGGALRQVLISLDELRGQDKPYWTALAALSAGYLETAAGRYDDALRHVREGCDLAERFGNAWLAAWSRVQLGTLDVARGRLGEARELLDKALDLSPANHSTRNVTLCLVAFARLAAAGGDLERAALLAGAVEGLRRRASLGRGRCCGGGRPSWSPSSAMPWAPTGSTLSMTQAPGSVSGRRWPPPRTGPVPAPRGDQPPCHRPPARRRQLPAGGQTTN